VSGSRQLKLSLGGVSPSGGKTSDPLKPARTTFTSQLTEDQWKMWKSAISTRLYCKCIVLEIENVEKYRKRARVWANFKKKFQVI